MINFDLEWMSFVKRNKKKTKTKEYGCTSILVKESTSFYFLDVMKIISCLTLLSRLICYLCIPRRKKKSTTMQLCIIELS